MEYKAYKITTDDVNRRNCTLKAWEKDIIRAYESISIDTNRELRLEKCLCKRCFVSTFLGGAAMTTTYCGICGKELLNGSTNVDTLCIECAKEHKLCIHCSADLDGKNRKIL